MVLVICAFDKCGNRRSKHNNSISFFSFPKNNLLLDQWLKFFNQHNEKTLTEENLCRGKMKLCHLHFEKSQIVVKSNKDRTLVKNSVPRCPPGIIDEAHAPNKQKKKKGKQVKPKNLPSKIDEAKKDKEVPLVTPEPESDKAEVDRCPLYHAINGYVVDLRIAAQQETFRLPNGKLIQVRRQPKKNDSSDPMELQDGIPTPASPTMEAPGSTTTEEPVLVTKPMQDRPKASKTYKNRRTVNQLSPDVNASSPANARRQMDTQSLPDVIASPTSSRNSSSRAARIAKQPTFASTVNHSARARTHAATPPAPPRTRAAQDPPISYIAPPILSSLQALIHKQHEDNPMGDFQKQFENRLISAADISLHVVSKLNNLVNSNPFKNASNERDLEELYTSVSYVLKYAIDRFKGLEDSCTDDVKQMNPDKQSDRGPTLDGASDKETNKNTPRGDAEDEEDDDCAIVEQRTDLIEIFSDDEDGEDSSQHSAKGLPVINLSPGQVRISSDTESVQEADNAEDESDAEETTAVDITKDTIDDYEITEKTEEDTCEGNEVAEESGEIEVVMKHEIEETTTEITKIIESYYHEEEDEADEPMDAQEKQDGEQGETETEDDDDVMAVYESGEGVVHQEDEEEDTEELIEIIEGDVDLDLEDGHEYKVVEIIDGDFYLVTNDNN